MQIEPVGDKRMQREPKQYSAPLVSTKPPEIKALRGMRDRGATDVPGKRVKRGLLNSDSPQDKVRLGLPPHALHAPAAVATGRGGFNECLMAKSSSRAYTISVSGYQK